MARPSTLKVSTPPATSSRAGTTYPDGGSRFETFFGDGSLGQVTGTAVSPVRYRYGVETISLGSAGTTPCTGVGNGGPPFPSFYTQQIKLDADGNETPEWTKTYQDTLGRTVKLLYADGSCSLSFYNAQGQLWKQRDPDGVVTFHTYSKRGEQDYTLGGRERRRSADRRLPHSAQPVEQAPERSRPRHPRRARRRPEPVRPARLIADRHLRLEKTANPAARWSPAPRPPPTACRPGAPSFPTPPQQ